MARTRANRGYVFSTSVAFVPHPHLPALWVRVHASVLRVVCPTCKAPPGQLCTRNGTVVHYSHWERRRSWRVIESKASMVLL